MYANVLDVSNALKRLFIGIIIGIEIFKRFNFGFDFDAAKKDEA